MRRHLPEPLGTCPRCGRAIYTYAEARIGEHRKCRPDRKLDSRVDRKDWPTL